MHKQNILLGKKGEDIAVGLLTNNGYKIVARNYKIKFGEIDVIAKDKDVFAFIEVKTRYSDRFGLPLEAISKFKQRQIARVALIFLKEHNLLDKKARFDVVSVLYSESGAHTLELIKNAFELEEGTYAI